jgi:hypothetical protein
LMYFYHLEKLLILTNRTTFHDVSDQFWNVMLFISSYILLFFKLGHHSKNHAFIHIFKVATVLDL